jgi:hypothetical protein
LTSVKPINYTTDTTIGAWIHYMYVICLVIISSSSILENNQVKSLLMILTFLHWLYKSCFHFGIGEVFWSENYKLHQTLV